MKKQIVIATLIVAIAAAAVPALAQSPYPELLNKESSFLDKLIYDSTLHDSIENIALKTAFKYLQVPLPPQLPDPRVSVTERDGATVVEFFDPGHLFVRCIVTNEQHTPIADGDEITIRTFTLELPAMY